MLLPVFAPVAARAATVIVANQTKNAWVWVTAYNQVGNIDKAWCVGPNERFSGKVGLALSNVRGEVTSRNCQHPRAADLWCAHSTAYGGTFDIVLKESRGRFSWECRRRPNG
jgi:hypothetical protein